MTDNSTSDRGTEGSALFISVIMPVRNEAESIRQIMSQLTSQDYDSRRFEILVVDGESNDGTLEEVAEFAERHENVSLF